MHGMQKSTWWCREANISLFAFKVYPFAPQAYGDPGSLLLREREECTRATAALVAAQRSLDEQQRRADGLQANLTLRNAGSGPSRGSIHNCDASVKLKPRQRGDGHNIV